MYHIKTMSIYYLTVSLGHLGVAYLGVSAQDLS